MGLAEGKSGDEEHQKGDSAAPPLDFNGFTVIKEGEAEILMLPKNKVFYNKSQVNNRDMSIAVLRTFISKRKQEHETMQSRRKKPENKVAEERSDQPDAVNDAEVHNGDSNEECEVSQDISQDEPCSISKKSVTSQILKGPTELKPLRVLEALSASGLRALRYAREIDGIGQVVALDIEKESVEACRRNIKFNGSVACLKVESFQADARAYMLTHPKEFDVVDLDPYGAPSVFLDSAVQSVVDGGLLMCTATDMAVLCGGNGEVCYSKYGSYPLKGKYCHEMALRILLACIESHANRYKRYIVPVLSVQMDFYVRVFVRIYTSASAMKNTPLKLSYVYQCTGCDSFHLQPIGRTVSKELPDVPLFLSLHNLSATLKCTSPSAVIFRSAVINAGFRISGTHVNPLGLKTDAPMHVVWDIMRCWDIKPWQHINLHSLMAFFSSNSKQMGSNSIVERLLVKNHPVKPQLPDQAGSVILAKEPVLQAYFARAVASLSKAQVKKVARFLPNPERHWGPKVRAGRQITNKHVSLLGAKAVDGANLCEDVNEPSTKRIKIEDSSTPSF